MTANIGTRTFIPFDIPATELAAGTSIEIVSPVDGYIDDISLIVQTAIVTGGAVTVQVGATVVAGLSATVADAAAKGTVISDTATAGSSTRAVSKGSRIQVIPAAAFNGGGALSGFLGVNSSAGAPA
jgi:hypothetical protein